VKETKDAPMADWQRFLDIHLAGMRSDVGSAGSAGSAAP
jgi:hypothetical protein